jgi:hypothetical protein
VTFVYLAVSLDTENRAVLLVSGIARGSDESEEDDLRHTGMTLNIGRRKEDEILRVILHPTPYVLEHLTCTSTYPLLLPRLLGC